MEMTIYYKGIDFDVKFDYQPEEPVVMYYKDGSGHPGCAEECSLDEIHHKGTDFYEFFENELTKIESIILNQIYEEYVEEY